MYLRVASVWQNIEGKQSVLPSCERMYSCQAISRLEDSCYALLAYFLIIAKVGFDDLERWHPFFG